MNTNYCGSFPHVDHSDCPSSTECTANLCLSCGEAPAGHGHFAFYCEGCAR